MHYFSFFKISAQDDLDHSLEHVMIGINMLLKYRVMILHMWQKKKKKKSGACQREDMSRSGRKSQDKEL